MSSDMERSAARLAAFTLVEAVQVRDVTDALAVAHAVAIEHTWPEVTRVLLYAEVVRGLQLSDPAVANTISRLHDDADAAGDRAMLSVALASRAEPSCCSGSRTRRCPSTARPPSTPRESPTPGTRRPAPEQSGRDHACPG